MFQQCIQQVSDVQSTATTYIRNPSIHSDAFSIMNLAGNPRCNYQNMSQRATISTLIGRGHKILECMTVCYMQSDCAYFVYSPTGYCHMFSSCIDRKGSRADVTYVRRGYENKHALHDIWDQFRILAEDTGRICDFREARQRATRSSLGGGGHSLRQCALSCASQADCIFLFSSPSGYCHMFSECDVKVDRPHAVIYVRKSVHAFEEHARHAKCAGVLSTRISDRSPVYSPNGSTGPMTWLGCAELCEMQHDRCNYFHLSSSGASCQMFVECTSTIHDTAYTVHRKKHRIQIDGISNYAALTSTIEPPPRSEAMLILKEDKHRWRQCPGTAPCGALVLGRWKYVHATWLNQNSEQHSYADRLTNDGNPYTQPVVCDSIPSTIASCSGKGEVCLFNLDTDPCEYTNVADDNLDMLSKMQNHLADYWQSSSVATQDDILDGACDGSVHPATSTAIGGTGILGFWVDSPRLGGPCKDYAPDCGLRSRQGHCHGVHPQYKYMYMNCRRECSLCDPSPDVESFVTTTTETAATRIPFANDFVTLQRGLRCDSHNALSVAPHFTLGGGGHTLIACQVACLAQSEKDCTALVFSILGFCHMFRSCVVVNSTMVTTTLIRTGSL
eukprot:m.1596983 g.1596983  ORF g.1596983 m.1596983 type:complete len:616 (-) comp25343_c2_seq10:6183-8030(-)